MQFEMPTCELLPPRGVHHLSLAPQLQVELLSPDADDYEKTPRMRVESGDATFAVCPSETVISCHTADASKPKLVAIATLLQKQTSAIVVLKDSGIERPSQLDGKRYSSYEGRFEMDIIRQLITDDGGKGTVEEVLPGEHGLGIFNTLLGGSHDATWVFMPWEGVIAKQKGVELNVFPLDNVPYGYTPVLVAHPDTVESADAKKFLAATDQGYRWAVSNQAEACTILVDSAKHKSVDLTPEMITQSLSELAPSILDPSGAWGRMEAAKWEGFTAWLFDKGIVKDRAGKPIPRIESSALFTNDLLPAA